MSQITIFALIAAVCAGIALFDGVFSMALGGDHDQRESHRLMFKRVGWQALAFLFVMVALL